MNGLLVRVAADQSDGGGSWNGPVDSRTREFVYVAIPESSQTHCGLNKPYAALNTALGSFGCAVPAHLAMRDMHLDPDFDHVTYGDRGERAKQISAKLGAGDLLVFYSGLRDMLPAPQLVYAIIGLYVVEEIVPAVRISVNRRHENAHTRRVLSAGAADIVVRARANVSGRLERCLPIGDLLMTDPKRASMKTRSRIFAPCPTRVERWPVGCQDDFGRPRRIGVFAGRPCRVHRSNHATGTSCKLTASAPSPR